MSAAYSIPLRFAAQWVLECQVAYMISEVWYPMDTGQPREREPAYHVVHIGVLT
jgi:hypothetical protein